MSEKLPVLHRVSSFAAGGTECQVRSCPQANDRSRTDSTRIVTSSSPNTRHVAAAMERLLRTVDRARGRQ